MPAQSLSSSVLARLAPVGAGHPAARRYARARRNLLPRAERVTAVRGAWAHREVLRLGHACETTLWCPGDAPVDADLLRLAEETVAAAGSAYVVSERTLRRLHPGATAPCLVSTVAVPRHEPARVLSAARLVLVADGVEYAGNLGTLVRTADACGAGAVVLTHATARVTHPLVFGASRGTVLTLPVLEYDDVALARADLRAAGLTAYVADPEGAVTYATAGLGTVRTALVVGSEGRGVSPAWRRDAVAVSIPMLGVADSLNVGTAAAVLLFAARSGLDATREG